MVNRRGQIVSGPYGMNARAYAARGWSVIPVSPQSKTCAVTGYTGASGAYPTRAEMEAWETSYALHNIGIRLPKDIIGIDVDAYGTKSGADTLAELEADLGELPPTYVITSRDDGISGIRLYRCDADAHWKGTAGAGIDILTWYHRYAVVFPSIHPDTAREYQWYHENTDKSYRLASCPSYADDIIPVLPRAWHDFLHSDQSGVKSGKLSHESIMDWLRDYGRGEPCDGMRRTEAIWLDALVDAADGGGAHDAMLSGVKAVIGDAVAGHPGMWDALERLGDAFKSGISSRRSSRDAATEWRRALYGAVRLYIGQDVPDEDPCLTMAAMAEGIVLGPGHKIVDREVVRQMAHEEAMRRIASLHEAEPPVAVRGDAFIRLDIPPVRMLVEGMLPWDGNSLLVAQRKAGKTTFVHNLIRSACDGEDFLAYGVEVPDDGKSIVLMDFEMIPGMLQDWLKSQGISPRGLERLQVLSFRGRNSSFNITSPHVRARWTQQLADVNAGYVILDCLAPAMYASNLNEDKNSEMGLFLSLIDEMLDQAGVSGMLAVHHMGHSGERGRGASRLRDWPETELHLVMDNGGEDDNGHLRPNAPRFLAGEGRFGALKEVMLGHDEKNRHLYVDGSDRMTEAVNKMKPLVLTYVAQNLGCSKNNIVQNITGLAKTKQMAISSLVDDELLCQHSGSRGAHNMWVASECPDPKFHSAKMRLRNR